MPTVKSAARAVDNGESPNATPVALSSRGLQQRAPRKIQSHVVSLERRLKRRSRRRAHEPRLSKSRAVGRAVRGGQNCHYAKAAILHTQSINRIQGRRWPPRPLRGGIEPAAQNPPGAQFARRRRRFSRRLPNFPASLPSVARNGLASGLHRRATGGGRDSHGDHIGRDRRGASRGQSAERRRSGRPTPASRRTTIPHCSSRYEPRTEALAAAERLAQARAARASRSTASRSR